MLCQGQINFAMQRHLCKFSFITSIAPKRMMASQGPFAATQPEITTDSSPLLGRRRMLGLGLAAAASSLIAPAAFASQGPSGDRTLTFYNTHTDEKLKATYFRG